MATIRRSSGCVTTNRRPSAISTRSGRRVARSGTVSVAPMRDTAVAETRYVTTVPSMTIGAATTWSSAPPTRR